MTQDPARQRGSSKLTVPVLATGPPGSPTALPGTCTSQQEPSLPDSLPQVAFTNCPLWCKGLGVGVDGTSIKDA